VRVRGNEPGFPIAACLCRLSGGQSHGIPVFTQKNHSERCERRDGAVGFDGGVGRASAAQVAHRRRAGYSEDLSRTGRWRRSFACQPSAGGCRACRCGRRSWRRWRVRRRLWGISAACRCACGDGSSRSARGRQRRIGRGESGGQLSTHQTTGRYASDWRIARWRQSSDRGGRAGRDPERQRRGPRGLQRHDQRSDERHLRKGHAG